MILAYLKACFVSNANNYSCLIQICEIKILFGSLRTFELVGISVAFIFDLSINSSIIDCGIFFIARFLLQYKQRVEVHTNLFLDDPGAFLEFGFHQIVDGVCIKHFLIRTPPRTDETQKSKQAAKTV